MGKKHKRSKAHSRFLLQVRLFCQKTCKTYDFVLLFQSENAKTEISITHRLRRISSASADLSRIANLAVLLRQNCFFIAFFLLNWEARRPERQAGPCASPVPPTTKNPQTKWSGDHGGAFSTALEPEPFIPDTAEDSTNHGEYGESPRFWHSR